SPKWARSLMKFSRHSHQYRVTKPRQLDQTAIYSNYRSNRVGEFRMPSDLVTVTMTVNGIERSADVEPRTLLVHYLRDAVGLTGTHVGCDTSQCGACVVEVDGTSTKSCTMFAVQLQGANVTTIEAL